MQTSTHTIKPTPPPGTPGLNGPLIPVEVRVSPLNFIRHVDIVQFKDTQQASPLKKSAPYQEKKNNQTLKRNTSYPFKKAHPTKKRNITKPSKKGNPTKKINTPNPLKRAKRMNKRSIRNPEKQACCFTITLTIGHSLRSAGHILRLNNSCPQPHEWNRNSNLEDRKLTMLTFWVIHNGP